MVWLYENVNTRIEGQIVGRFKFNLTRHILTIFSPSGFDEYMNLVLDNATECHMKRGTRKQLGRIMLKGDSITLIQTKDEK